jgi:hypothetical protein
MASATDMQASLPRPVSHAPGDGVCSECGEDHPFEMPPELLESALSRNLVVFAGAGISTESRRAIGSTFADSIRHELGIAPVPSTPFSRLMTAYEQRFGRRQLLQQIRARLEYMKGFADLQRAATRFHRELATAFFLDEIVTTNWDTYFEDYSGAIPIVIPDDYAYWDVRGRKVFKLHGSMHNLSTITATEADYARCYRRLRSGTIGSTLKHLIATKRVLFVGYSFGDEDLSRVLRFMQRELGDVLPRSFVATPHGYQGDALPQDRVIKTDGTHFLRVLKAMAVERGAMRPDSVFDSVRDLTSRVSAARHRAVVKARPNRYPAAIYAWSYQDGLLHALGRILALRTTGHYSDPSSVRSTLHTYEHARQGAMRTRNYWDASYIEGYMNGMLSLELDQEVVKQTPLYFVWGSALPMLTFNEFQSELKRAGELHKTAMKKAIAIVRDAGGYDPVHPPALDMDSLLAAAR